MSSPVVIDASAGVEMIARTTTGASLRTLLPADAVPWVPDGLFDAEVAAVLRRWDLRRALGPEAIATAVLRLQSWRLRRASVAALVQPAWQLRHNFTFTDACYVALAVQVGGVLLTSDHRLAQAPTMPVPVLRPTM